MTFARNLVEQLGFDAGDGDYAFALDDAEDREAREVHRWHDATHELTIEFNGAGGPRTAAEEAR